MTYLKELGCILACVILTAVAQAVHAASDAATLRDRLRESKNEAYIAVRDEVLALDADRFADLLEALRLETNDWLDHLLADMIEARREFPELAAQFDERRAYTLAHPSHLITGQTGYSKPWLPPDSNDVNILIFESVFKIETPTALRRGYLLLLADPDRATREATGPLLKMVEEEEWKELRVSAVMALATTAGVHPDVRVTPAFLQIYRRTREQEIEAYSPQSSSPFDRSYGVTTATGHMACEEGLVCVSSMIAIEIELATEHGFAPWETDIETVGAEFLAAEKRQRDELRAMRSGRKAHNEQRLAKLAVERNAAHERLFWQDQWYTLHQSKSRIEAALAEREEKPERSPARDDLE